MEYRKSVIGVLIMGGSARLETYLHRSLPQNIEMATTRIPFASVSSEGLVEMIDAIPDAARILSEALPDLVVVTNFTASCLKGKEMCNMIQQAAGVPALVPCTEFVEALRLLNAKNIAVVSAFSPELNLLEKLFFYEHQINVCAFHHVECMSPNDPVAVSFIETEQVMHTLRTADFSGVDAILIDVPIFLLTTEVQQALSALTKRPVLTMAEILLWSCFRRLGAPCGDLYLSRFLP